MWKRRLRRLLSFSLGLLIVSLVFLLCERWRGQWALARCYSDLKAKGEKLTFAEVAPPVPEGDNSAPEVVEAAQKLEKGSVMPNRRPPAMTIVPSGRAIAWFQQSEWVEDKLTNTWSQVADDLRQNEPALARIRAALAKPVLRNPLDFSLGYGLRFDHLTPMKSLARWFGSACQLALREGRNRDAIDHAVLQMRLARILAEDRIVISELVRHAIAAIAKCSAWESLQSGGWTDPDLARLQEAWASEDFLATLVHCLEGERAYGLACVIRLRQSNEEAVQAMFWQEEFLDEIDDPGWHHWPGMDFLRKQVYCRIWRFAWSHQDERRYLLGMQRLLEIARAAGAQQSYASIAQDIDRLADETSNLSRYDRLRFALSPLSLSTLSAVIRRGMQAETDKAMVVCAIALKRHSLRHGQPPSSLDMLAPEFAPSAPVDMMDGKPLKYRIDADGRSMLYSVGPNGLDDGGDATMPPSQSSSRNSWNRMDYLWPSPALPEEIEAYRKEAAVP